MTPFWNHRVTILDFPAFLIQVVLDSKKLIKVKVTIVTKILGHGVGIYPPPRTISIFVREKISEFFVFWGEGGHPFVFLKTYKS